MRRIALAAAFAAVSLSACSDDGSQPPPHTSIAAPAPPVSTETTAGTDGAARHTVAEGRGFDFYVLALSWSPSYCESEGRDANRQQCASGRAYSFIVHGLWPQHERGYPADCETNERDVPRHIASSLYDIMPSAGLIRQQWRKHGSCSGLSQADYFDVLRAARQRVNIPTEFRKPAAYRTVNPKSVEQSFRDANPGLPADGIAVACDRRFLDEVRICMTKTLEFRSCPEVDRRDCRSDRAVMPPVRGG